jgi:hypothetical protein
MSARCSNRYSVAFGQQIVLTQYLVRANHRAIRNLRGSLAGEATCLRKLVGFSFYFHKLSDDLILVAPPAPEGQYSYIFLLFSGYNLREVRSANNTFVVLAILMAAYTDST